MTIRDNVKQGNDFFRYQPKEAAVILDVPAFFKQVIDMIWVLCKV